MNSVLAYIGFPGTGLGLRLAGIAVHEAVDGPSVTALVRSFKQTGTYRIVFVDEQLVSDVREDISKLNNDPLPAIVLLPNPNNPLHLTQKEMNDLVIRAVGSDIFGNS